MRDPKTPAEWKEAVAEAAFLRWLYDAKLYGLISGGPAINARRCDEILERGCLLGYHPPSYEQMRERLLGRKEPS